MQNVLILLVVVPGEGNLRGLHVVVVLCVSFFPSFLSIRSWFLVSTRLEVEKQLFPIRVW